jgi:hypothetical protein
MNSLLIEARLDDIKSEFRLITAAGRALPVQLSPKVLSVGVEGAFYRYPVTAELKASPAGLSQNGATGTNINPLSLREIFLQLVRKEQPCTSGNAGATPVHSSLRS